MPVMTSLKFVEEVEFVVADADWDVGVGARCRTGPPLPCRSVSGADGGADLPASRSGEARSLRFQFAPVLLVGIDSPADGEPKVSAR